MKNILLIFLFLLSFNLYAQGAAGNTVSSLSKSCQEMQRSPLLGISQVYIPKIWPSTTPVFPFVGIVTGITQHESIVFKICDILIQMDQVGIGGTVLRTGQFLNELTGNEFDDELSLVSELHDLSNSIYDFETGQTREGALESAANHRKLVNFIDSTTKYYQKKSNSAKHNRPEGLETTAERRAKLTKVAQLSYKRAIISESLNCPDPRSQGNVNFQKKYINFVPEREHKIRQAENSIEYFHRQLLDMGVEINNEISDMQEYTSQLNQIVYYGATYRTTTDFHEKKDIEITDELDRNGNVKKKNTTKRVRVNTFDVRIDQITIQEFRKKYTAKWEDWLDKEIYLQGTEGLLNGKRGRIEAKFKNYAFECSEIQLQRQLPVRDRNNPRYYDELKKAQADCRDQLVIRPEGSKNLMFNYINRLVLALREKYKNQAEIWNFEAVELGYNRVIDDRPQAVKNEITSFQQMDVACSDSLKPVEMAKLQMKSREVNTELKEAWAEAKIKRAVKEDIVENASRNNKESIERNQEKEIMKSSSSVSSETPPLDLNPKTGI